MTQARTPLPFPTMRVLQKPEKAAAMTRQRRRIGLLGGSFNPAHQGHVHISMQALRRLGLDDVWWLVSPQNPLKATRDMAAFRDRMASAEKLARHPRIRVSDLESRLGTRYTVDTVKALQRRHPDCAFVWLMGADNLSQLPAWKDWTQILKTVAVAIFARPSYSLKSLAGQAAAWLSQYRLSETEARGLASREPPAWVFMRVKLHPASSTFIRAAKGK
ncbi:MAG: nicotinate-nucleotide adenylyltransferase [Alphaproteobacteria bacterium]|nr:nicotinate-nucleotide adenylyltransferase [Alphaproteobacteria bacterium]